MSIKHYKFKMELMTRLNALLLGLLLALLIVSCSEPKFRPSERVRLFDSDWKFKTGDIIGAETVAFGDADWRKLDLPHDWSIEDLAPISGVKQIGPFSSESQGGGSTGHVVGGIGWYRKTFTIGQKPVNKKVSIQFDGVYMESDVWVNGKHVGFHPYGYTPFGYDITPYINPDGNKNVIAVKVNNPGKNSRWYSGSGIYRHVELVVTNQVNIAWGGNYITTPNITKELAIIQMESTIENSTGKEQNASVITTILNPNGEIVIADEQKMRLSPDKQTIVNQALPLKSPMLWSPEVPTLYKAAVVVKVDGIVKDQTITTFGIRSISFNPLLGFVLNGKQVELKGGCMHHDNGILGAATYDRAEERRVELMKKFGYNAIRTSHNPPSHQFLDACDRLGILVIDEAFDMWNTAKKPEDYHRYFKEWHEKDIQSMVMRDRNHPSVIIWSIGNEIPERADSSGLETQAELRKLIRQLDITRPVTEAVCEFWETKGRDWNDTRHLFAGLDLCGYNYQWKRYESDNMLFPERIIVGTESTAREAFDNWKLVKEKPYVIGDFLWTAMDYLGESAIGHTSMGPATTKEFTLTWPWYNAWCGDIDICGFKKDQSYYRDVVWGISDLEMAAHAPVPEGQVETVSYWGWPDERQSWNWKGMEGKKLSVSVYSNYPSVKLELNGTLIGIKTISTENKLTATFEVPYASGELKAIGMKDGKEVRTIALKTTGAVSKIRLTPDRSTIRNSRNDLSYVTVELLDADGQLVPDQDQAVTFTVSGHGEAAGIGSANPAEMRSFKSPVCNTFRGRCLVILRPTGTIGEITLSAVAIGVEGAGCKVFVN